jgi:hypothetical protein
MAGISKSCARVACAAVQCPKVLPRWPQMLFLLNPIAPRVASAVSFRLICRKIIGNQIESYLNDLNQQFANQAYVWLSKRKISKT